MCQVLPLAVLAAGSACSGGDGGTDPTGSFTISVSPGSLTVEQGASRQATLTWTRVDGFAGTVAVAVQGAPTGVTGSVTGGGSGATSTGTVSIYETQGGDITLHPVTPHSQAETALGKAESCVAIG